MRKQIKSNSKLVSCIVKASAFMMAAMLTAGCANTTEGAVDAAKVEEELQTEASEDKAENKEVNTAMEVHLPFDVDSDYEWNYEIEDNSVVAITEDTTLAPGEKTDSETRAIDAGEILEKETNENTGTRVFVIESMAAGETNVTFTYEKGNKSDSNYSYADKVIVKCKVDDETFNLTTEMTTDAMSMDVEDYMNKDLASLEDACKYDVLDYKADGYLGGDYFYNEGIASITYHKDGHEKTYAVYTSLFDFNIAEALEIELEDKEVNGHGIKYGKNKTGELAMWPSANEKLFYYVYFVGDNIDNSEEILGEAIKESEKLSGDVYNATYFEKYTRDIKSLTEKRQYIDDTYYNNATSTDTGAQEAEAETETEAESEAETETEAEAEAETEAE